MKKSRSRKRYRNHITALTTEALLRLHDRLDRNISHRLHILAEWEQYLSGNESDWSATMQRWQHKDLEGASEADREITRAKSAEPEF
jgi:hypothetical protein